MIYDAQKAIPKARRRAEDANHDAKRDEDTTAKQSTNVKKADISVASVKTSKDKGQGKKRTGQSVSDSDIEASESHQDDSSMES